MELGRGIWKVIPRGLGAELRKTPWILSCTTRQTFEKNFNLTTDDLLLNLAKHVSTTSQVPSAAGFCSTSGKVYLAPSLKLGSQSMDAVQVLLANVFAQGDGGLDSIASTASLSYQTSNLVRESVNFAGMRWLSDSGQHTSIEDAIPNEGAAGQAQASSGSGTCFQHEGYSPLDSHAFDDTAEGHGSLAKAAAARAYSPSFDDVFSGCAVRTNTGLLFAGSAISTFARGIELSPLKVALVSMGSQAGGSYKDVHSVLWTAVTDNHDVQEMCANDRALLKEIASSAVFVAHGISGM